MKDGNEKLYDAKARSDEAGLLCEDPSLTVQSDAEDADINVIVKRFGVGQPVPQGMRLPEYGDYTDVEDYRSALEAIRGAEENFMLMPAELRAKFANDPHQFLEFVNDPRNGDELIELGLRDRPVAPVAPATAASTPQA